MFSSSDPHPVLLINADGPSPFLLTGDHEGNRIPSALGGLGLDAANRQRHIAWDIGIDGVGSRLAAQLDAPFIAQRYSRLVIDCNRDPTSDEAIPAISDGTVIPANQDLSMAERAQRMGSVHAPYHAAISDHITRRLARDEPPIIVALHSFTPAMDGFDRPWHIGVLHWGGDDRFARALLNALRSQSDLIVGDNEPYRMDATDFSVPLHAITPGLPYAEIEIRQDLIESPAGQAAWGERLSEALETARLSVWPSPNG